MTEWQSGLSGLTGEQVKRGLDSWSEAWPPSLPEFRAVCIGATEQWQHASPAYRRFPPVLPKPKADPAIVKAELAKMRGKA